MSILKSLTIKNLKLNKKRTIVTVIGITLATALIVALSSLISTFKTTLIETEKYESGDYHYKFSNVPEDEIKYITNNRNIEKASITQNIGYATLEGSKNTYKSYLYLQAFSKDAMDNLSIHIIDGRLPENEDEIIISNDIKTGARVKYNIGDTLTLKIGSRVSDGYELYQSNPNNGNEHLEEKFTKTYKIVGTIETPLRAIEPYVAPGYTIITYLNENNITSNADIYVRYTKEGLKNPYKTTADILGTDEKTIESASQRLKSDGKVKYDYDNNYMLLHYETMSFSDSTMATIYGIAGIIVAIIIVTSVFCIRNSFAISITEKVKQYGMLSSVGATSKQIKKNVYFESMVLAIIGIPLGIILGIVATIILVNVCNALLGEWINVLIEYKASAFAILIAIILSIITCLLSARSSAKKASKIAPIDAIRESADVKIKGKKVKSPKFIKKCFGIGGDIAYKNLKRNKKKYRTTVISIVVCVSVFIATSSFVDLAFKTLKIARENLDYNVLVYSRGVAQEECIEKLESIPTLENINKYSMPRFINSSERSNLKLTKAYENLQKESYGTSETSNEYLKIVSVGKDEYSRFIKKLGLNYEESKDKIILLNSRIIQKTDEKGNVKKIELNKFENKRGDMVNIGIKDKHIEIEVCAVTNEVPMGLASESNFISIAIVSDEFFDKYKSETNPQSVSMYIDSSNPDKLQDDIEEYMGDYVYTVNYNKEFKSQRSLFIMISIFLYGFIGVIALIGITSIFNTITTSMELRSKEFAMLKSVGMTKKEFNKMINLESIFYGSKSLIIGIPIGIGISYALFKVLCKDIIEFSYQFPINGILISIIAVFVLVAAIMKFSQSKINKQNIIETIRRDNI